MCAYILYRQIAQIAHRPIYSTYTYLQHLTTINIQLSKFQKYFLIFSTTCTSSNFRPKGPLSVYLKVYIAQFDTAGILFKVHSRWKIEIGDFSSPYHTTRRVLKWRLGNSVLSVGRSLRNWEQSRIISHPELSTQTLSLLRGGDKLGEQVVNISSTAEGGYMFFDSH